MASILVLFNLKAGMDVATYERWARERDLPTVRGLGSVAGFDVMRAQSLLMGEGKPPYQYAEVIDVKDMAAFGKDMSSDVVQKGAAEFQTFADNPIFIVCEKL
jgi:REDY-like protein HapK